MGFLKNMLKTGATLTKNVTSAIGDAAAETAANAKKSFETTKLEGEIKDIDVECAKFYAIIGQKYVQSTITRTNLNVQDEVNSTLQLLRRKVELQKKIKEIEQSSQQHDAIPPPKENPRRDDDVRNNEYREKPRVRLDKLRRR